MKLHDFTFKIEHCEIEQEFKMVRCHRPIKEIKRALFIGAFRTCAMCGGDAKVIEVSWEPSKPV